jgi:long-chain acyl-CoA synthetase
VEAFVRSINFPYTVSYGMTETGPIISHVHWTKLKHTSCGLIADRMEAKILSPDGANIPGELVVRGTNVMLGYYKNEEDTRAILDEDGWLHTGDMAVIDHEGNLFLKGRCKNMLLTASGQNIYPEEIESRLNNMPLVNESLVVLRGDKLVALVYPDSEEAFAKGLNQEGIEEAMEQNRIELNRNLPAYSQIAKCRIYPEEFEKTAKKSIKRFLYKDAD